MDDPAPGPQRPTHAAAPRAELPEPGRFRRELFAAVALPLVLMASLTAILATQVVELLELTRAVERTDRVVAEARRTETLLVDLEAGLRGYLLTDRAEFLEPFARASAELPEAFSELERLLDAPVQAGRLRALRRGHAAWATYAERLLAAHDTGADAVELVATARGKRLMDGLRAQVEALVEREEELRDSRSAQTTLLAWRSAVVAVALTFLLGGLLGLVWRRRLLRVAAGYERVLGAHRRDAAALREREALFTAFMNHTAGVAFMKDAAGRFVYVNAGMERLFRRPAAELLGRTDADVLPADVARRLRENDLAVLTSGRTQQLLETVPGADRRLRRWLVLKFPFHDAAGQPLLGGVGVDVEDRERALEAIQRMNAELERRVERRTAQLTAANRELEAFSYSVSHDLRAPLRAIHGFSRAALEDHGEVLGPPGRELLERVCAAADRMARLIDDLLELSRLTRAELARAPVDVTALAGEVAEDLRRAERDRDVRVDVAPGLVASADPRLVRVVLENLIGNAWKFTAGVPEPRVEVGALASDDRAASTFFVRDNGVGFDLAHAGKLFTPFHRLHAARAFPGTGVGLASVQRVVRRHGGRIWAEAAPGRGATFFFTLQPDGAAPAPGDGQQAAAAGVADGEPSRSQAATPSTRGEAHRATSAVDAAVNGRPADTSPLQAPRRSSPSREAPGDRGGGAGRADSGLALLGTRERASEEQE